MFFSDIHKEIAEWEKEDKTWTSEKLLAAYTQPISPESQVLNEKLYELVDKVTSNLINTFGMLPDPRDIDISSVTRDEKTYLVIEPTEEFRNRLRSKGN